MSSSRAGYGNLLISYKGVCIMSKFLKVKTYLENWDKATREGDSDARPTLFDILRLFDKLLYFKYSQYDTRSKLFKEKWNKIAAANKMTLEDLRGYIIDSFCIDSNPNVDFWVLGYTDSGNALVKFEVNSGDRFDEVPVYIELEWDLSDDDK